MFTSGSTGLPKGVVVPARGVLALLADRAFADMPSDARWLQITSPAFDISNLEIWGALLHGACCVVQHADASSLDDIGRTLASARITHAQMSTSLFNAMVDERLDRFAGLTQMMVGGERVSPQHMRRFLERHPTVALINAYGPTETSIWSLGHRVGLVDTQNAAGVPIGRPVAGTQLRIDQPDAATGVGELWIAGLGVSDGYLNDPAKTAERFVWLDGQRWYRTGDLARLRSDELFEYFGRLDRQTKINGIRIELDEIEWALGRVPGVGEAAVMLNEAEGRPARLVGAYTSVGTKPPTLAEIRRHLAERIPESTIPQALECLPAMPRNTNGKLDRTALAARFRPSSVPAGDAFSSALRLAMGAHASRPALQAGQRVLSYAELDQRSQAAAGWLRAQGVAPGDVVALRLPRSVDLVIAMVAAVRCGATFAALDLDSPRARIESMLSVLQPRLVVDPAKGPNGHGDTATAFPQATWPVDPVTDTDPGDAVAHADWVEWPAAQALCLMFTSGSTGLPKGVLVPAAGVHRLVHEADFARLAPGQRWAFLSSPAFDASHLEIWGPLLNGGTCVVYEGALDSLDSLSDFLRAQGISDAWLTAALFNALIDHDAGSLTGLVQLLVGGERLSVQHVRAALAALPSTTLINGYGPTENTTFTLCHRITTSDLDESSGIPIGRSIHGTVARIDGDGDEGELLAGGAGVALGYLRDPESTRLRFVEQDGQRWYRTGDLVRRRADGAYLYLGRIDRQVKIQGQRIELDEIEHLMSGCPGVGDAAILVVGHGADNRHLVGIYGGTGDRLPDPEAVAAYLAERLAPAACPRRLVALAAMPRNASGKLDRARLARDHGGQVDDGPSAAAPPPPIVQDLALPAAFERIWRRYLPGAQAGAGADFIAAGGTSLVALRMAAAIAQDLGRSVSPVDLLRNPQFSAQLALVETALPESPTPSAAPAEVGPTLTRAQLNLVRAGMADASHRSMLVHVALVFEPGLQPDRLRQAFVKLADRHPILRLAVAMEAGQLRTHLLPSLAGDWWADRGRLHELPTDLHCPSAVLDTVGRALDLEHRGPMRVDRWQAEDGRSLVIWTVHHFAIDEHSIDRALRELSQLMDGQDLHAVHGSPFAMVSLESAWSDKRGVHLLAQQLSTELRNAQLPYQRHGHEGRELQFEVPPGLVQAVDAAVARWGWTPFPLLLAAFGMAVQASFGAQFKRILTPFSRRTEPELDEPLGYFLDVRHVEAGIRSAELPGQFLARVHQTLADAQQPGFQLLEDVIDETARLDPGAAQLLGAFGFTWRLAPARALLLGGVPAQMVRLPQRGARFDLALHAAQVEGTLNISIEAIAPLVDDGSAQRVFDRFVQHLESLCAAEPRVGASAPRVDDSGNTHALTNHEAIERVWRRWAPYTPSQLSPQDSFVRLGGSSLAAMRMASDLKRQFGMKLETGRFLARPTFGHLLNLVVQQSAAPELDAGMKRDLALIGDSAAPRVVLLIPGLGGHAVGLLNVANEIRRLAGSGCLVAIADLERIVASQGEADPGRRTLDRLLALAHALGPSKLALVAGFSLGGLMALQLARELGSGCTARVGLLDTFCPTPHDGTLLRALEARLARRWLRAPAAHELNAARPSEAFDIPERSAASERSWRQLETYIVRQPLGESGRRVQLIQAEHSRADIGMLWRGRTNGFDARRFGEFSVYRIPAWHVDLLNRAARVAAHLMVVSSGLDAAETRP